MAKKKNRNELEILRDELQEYKKDGLLESLSASFLEKLQFKINVATSKFFKKYLSAKSMWYSSNYRRNFWSTKKSLFSRNVGLKSYKLEDLNSEFASAYRAGIELSLSLIKSHSDETKLKMRRRFLDWVTSADYRDKEDLNEAIKLPSDKKTKFLLRDQTNKLASTLDNIVAEKYGAIAFQWKVRNDNKVSGKPGGKNEKADKDSKVHGDHWSRKDKFYYYTRMDDSIKAKLNLKKFAGSEKDLKDGMPGIPIGCRCYAKNFYFIEDLPAEFIKAES